MNNIDNLKSITISIPALSNEFKTIQTSMPRTCPHCSITIHPRTQSLNVLNYSSTEYLLIYLHNCPDCNKSYITIHLKKIGGQNNSADFVSIYPNTHNATFQELLQKTSPKFVDMYNQAYTAEQLNHTDLAAIGYRSSLEILIKDFAINALHHEPNQVKKKSLFEAIGTYLEGSELLTSADVIRILGNDSTHYERKYSSVEFSVLKKFLLIFITQIEAKLLLLNPPVPIPVRE